MCLVNIFSFCLDRLLNQIEVSYKLSIFKILSGTRIPTAQSFDLKHTVKLAFTHSIILMVHLFRITVTMYVPDTVECQPRWWDVGVGGGGGGGAKSDCLSVCISVLLVLSFCFSPTLLSANRSAPLTNRQITIVVSLLAPPPPDAILYPNVIWGLSPGVGTLSPAVVIVLYPLFTLQIRPLHFSTPVTTISVNFQ